MRRKGFIAIACLPALLTLAPGALALPRITAVACFSGDAPPALGQAWTLSPLLLGPLVLFVLYVAGVVGLWRQAGVGRGISVAAAGAFLAGSLVFFLATAWPIDAYAGWSLAAHVGQHMLLLAVAPPLLLAGRPLAGIAHALPRQWAQRLHAWAAPVHPWLAARLGSPGLRVVESDEDMLLYDIGHIPGAVRIDWHTDLNGGTVMTVGDEGVKDIVHHYVDASHLWKEEKA